MIIPQIRPSIYWNFFPENSELGGRLRDYLWVWGRREAGGQVCVGPFRP